MYINYYGKFYSAHVSKDDYRHQSFFGFKLPQEAYSAAFDYIINNNLI